MRLESSRSVQHVADTDIHMYAGIHLKSGEGKYYHVVQCWKMAMNV